MTSPGYELVKAEAAGGDAASLPARVGRPRAKTREELTNVWSFLFAQLGVDPWSRQ
jgi:hypothetical protein